MPFQNLFFRTAVKRNLTISDHLTRRSIPSYCIPAKNDWCVVIYNNKKTTTAKILEATGGMGLEVKELTAEKAHLVLWHGIRKVFWILIDNERGDATYRPDMLKSLLNHLTSKRSEMQFLRELTLPDLEEILQSFGKLEPKEACLAFMEFLDLVEVEFPDFAEVDAHFENAATKNKQSYWIQS